MGEKKNDDIDQENEERQIKFFRKEAMKRLKNEKRLTFLKVVYYLLG